MNEITLVYEYLVKELCNYISARFKMKNKTILKSQFKIILYGPLTADTFQRNNIVYLSPIDSPRL